jgi:hypothetical protein
VLTSQNGLPFCLFAQGERLSRLVREAILGEKITLSRGAEILGLKTNVMREIVGSWAN